ncbi:DinB family protein [Gramella sp. KN1008]|uniref:DinB family protein n=1 Tax=Gramella sp. KN1008 TaxID=2529298 RepID=UPI0013F14911|nr:DinB family protein [Gramella sp. KN1008]
MIRSLSEIFEGEPWYGESVMKKLENVPYKIGYETCVPDSHSVAEIVGHLISWKSFAAEKLNDNNGYDIEIDSETDWPIVEIKSPEEWEALKRRLVAAQSNIYKFLEAKPDDSFLEEKVNGQDYNFEFLIRGIIQHDIYHLGQIGLIESQLKRKEENSGVFKS